MASLVITTLGQGAIRSFDQCIVMQDESLLQRPLLPHGGRDGAPAPPRSRSTASRGGLQRVQPPGTLHLGIGRRRWCPGSIFRHAKDASSGWIAGPGPR
jgi:hypothetical protein